MSENVVRVGVVIQGPLVTYGQGPNNSPTGFVATETIRRNVKSVQNNNMSYVVITWEPSGELEALELEGLVGDCVHVVSEPTPKEFDPDHRYKQHYGIYKGCMSLLAFDDKITHFLKIRTDMEMPTTFWSWVGEIVDRDDDRLYVSELMHRSYYIGDFVYLAKREVMLAFLENVISYKGDIVHPCIALDMGVKYCKLLGSCSEYKNKLIGNIRFLCGAVFSTAYFRESWNDLIKNRIGVIPEPVWTKITWRNRKIGEFIDTSSFKFNVSPIRNKTSIAKNAKLLFGDFLIYWAKAKKYNVFRLLAGRMGFLISVVNRLSRKIVSVCSKIAKKKKGVVLGRVACLGKELFRLHKTGEPENTLVNQQKVRVDWFVKAIHSERRCEPEIVREHLSRADIFPFLEEQSRLPWMEYKNCEYLLMDSFAELTDQLFEHKKGGWSFCCHYTDIEHTEEFERDFECKGLLPIAEIEQAYREYFNWFESSYPGTNIVFAHFPATLDSRVVFKERAAEIMRVITNFEKERPYLKSIFVDDDAVKRIEGDEFPYHFAHDTNLAFIEKWNVLV